MLQNSSGNFGISLNKRQIDREAVEVKGRGEEDKDIVVEEIFVFLEMFLLLLKKKQKTQCSVQHGQDPVSKQTLKKNMPAAF